MRHTVGSQQVFTLAALRLALVIGAQTLEIRTLSGRPDMVTGGTALVELSGASLNGVRVTPTGRIGVSPEADWAARIVPEKSAPVVWRSLLEAVDARSE